MVRTVKATGKQSQLRIIGGQWRGRKLSFTPAEGLRPTSDRVRETLFNWVAPHINGARCADLFSGSGALGLEALSRGARHCDFVDTSPTALAQIDDHLTILNAATAGLCHRTSAQQFMQTVRMRYDLIFVDPPFGKGLVDPTCALLAERQLLNTGGMVYVETASSEPPPTLPPGWSIYRDKSTSGVAYRLLSVD